MSIFLSVTAKKAATQSFLAHRKMQIKSGMLRDARLLCYSRILASPSNHITSLDRLICTSRNVNKDDGEKSLQLHHKTFPIHYYCNSNSVHAPFPLFKSSQLLSPELLRMSNISFRFIHLSSSKYESKVVETLEAMKDNIKKDVPIDQSKVAEQTVQSQSSTSIQGDCRPSGRLVAVQDNTYPSQISEKLPLTTRIINELKHYYHGFRLLFIDVRVSMRLIWAVINGKTLMRRERKQLVRTTADLFRLVPFLVFVIVPFAEFLLPVVLKFFPGMLPSTFQEANKEQEKMRKRLKLKLEMAKFLQDTIEETALQRTDGKGDSVHDFVNFMNKIRTSGVQTSNEEILKFSKLFEDEITLDNLSPAQLRAMCQMLDITPVGPSYILRFQLEMKLRDLETDDKMIQREGVDSMAVWELQDACRQRAMRSFGVPEERLKGQLVQWLDLHLNLKIPTSLLLLSRTLYFPEHISTEDQLRATILALPETLTDEAKVKISEVSGDRVDNKSKLEVIRQEEELIMQEKQELEQAVIKETEEIKVDLSKEPVASEKVLVDQMPALDTIVGKEEGGIHTKDLEHLEDALDMVAESKQKLKVEVEDLKNLKEEFTEYKESVDKIKGILASSTPEVPVAAVEESKAAKRLGKKVEKMISKLDVTVSKLSAESIKATEPPATATVADATAAAQQPITPEGFRKGDNIPDLCAKELLEKQMSLITITELLGAIEKLESGSQMSSKYEIIAKVLDEDHDGLIDYKEALRFVELLGKENLKINSDQMSEIVKILKKEKELLEGNKLKKQQEQQQTYQVHNIPVQPVSSSSEAQQLASAANVEEAATTKISKKAENQPEKHL